MKLDVELRLRSHSEIGFLVQFLRDPVYYVVDLSDVPKSGSFNPYGNEQMSEDIPLITFEDSDIGFMFDNIQYSAEEDKTLNDLSASDLFSFHYGNSGWGTLTTTLSSAYTKKIFVRRKPQRVEVEEEKMNQRWYFLIKLLVCRLV
jgi:hypothetical protein